MIENNVVNLDTGEVVNVDEVEIKKKVDKRYTAFVGSINYRDYKHSDLPMLLEKLVNLFESIEWIENYYCISHDETDKPHIHYVIELSVQKRRKTMLNDFERWGFDRDSVNCKPLGYLHSSLRYFLHIDEKSVEEGKKQYTIDCIVSNMSQFYITTVINDEDDEVTTDKLINLCLDCDGNKVNIMRSLGLKTYHKYRSEISDILNYEYGLRVAREKERDRRKKEMLDSLPF